MEKLTLKHSNTEWDDHGLFELEEPVKLKSEITFSTKDKHYQPIVIGQPDCYTLYPGIAGKVLNRRVTIINNEMRVYYQVEFLLGSATFTVTLHESMLESHTTENNSNAD